MVRARAGLLLPMVMLGGGIALPLVIAKPGSSEANGIHASASAVQFSLDRMADSKTASPGTTAASMPEPPAAEALRAILLTHDSPLDRLRLRRALQAVDAPGCQALVEAFAKAPGSLSAEHQFYVVMRAETEERWIRTDPSHAALSGYLKNNNFPERAIRFLAARDFAAAQALAREVQAALSRPGETAFFHELIGGLASTDLTAALEFVEKHSAGWRRTALDSAVETQPEQVLKLLADEPMVDPWTDLWIRGLQAMALTDPAKALRLYRSRDFPNDAAQSIERGLLTALIARAPEMALREAGVLKSSCEGAEFIAKHNVPAALEYVRKFPDTREGLASALILPDPASALMRWSPVSAEPLEQWLWWRAAMVRTSSMNHHRAGQKLSENDRAAVQGILAGAQQYADSTTGPDRVFADLLGSLRGIDAGLAGEMAAMTPDKWGAEGAAMVENFLRTKDFPENRPLSCDEVESATTRFLTPATTAAGYFDFAGKRMHQEPGTALEWAHGQSADAKLGALAGIAACTKVDGEASGTAAMEELLALNQPEHPVVVRALARWAAGFSGDPAEASARLADLPRGPVFDVAAAGLSGSLMQEGDPESALHWAAAIGNPLRRNVAVDAVMAQWQSQSHSSGPPAAARQILGSLQVPESVKQQLTARFFK